MIFLSCGLFYFFFNHNKATSLECSSFPFSLCVLCLQVRVQLMIKWEHMEVWLSSAFIAQSCSQKNRIFLPVVTFLFGKGFQPYWRMYTWLHDNAFIKCLHSLHCIWINIKALLSSSNHTAICFKWHQYCTPHADLTPGLKSRQSAKAASHQAMKLPGSLCSNLVCEGVCVCVNDPLLLINITSLCLQYISTKMAHCTHWAGLGDFHKDGPATDLKRVIGSGNSVLKD